MTYYPTQRPLSSSLLGLPCRILNISDRKELLRGLWVYTNTRILITRPLAQGSDVQETLVCNDQRAMGVHDASCLLSRVGSMPDGTLTIPAVSPKTRRFWEVPIGSLVVPFGDLSLGSYEVIPQRNY